MYGLETEEISLCSYRRHSPPPPPPPSSSSSSSENPRLPALVRVLPHGTSVWKHRAFFWCLDLGAASLVPLYVPMFTMAALKPHCLNVFALMFIYCSFGFFFKNLHKMFLQCS